MNETEHTIASIVHAALDTHEQNRPRSRQGFIGISELGTCRQKTLYKLLRTDETDHRLKMAALIGDAIGERCETAITQHVTSRAWEGVRPQETIQVDLPSGRFQLQGHPDLTLPRWGILDLKTKNGLELVRSTGADQQNRFQRHLYTLGASQCGLLEIPAEEAMTGNVYIDRSGSEEYPHVEVEQFNWGVVYEAEEWLGDVVYAAENGEDASRDKPRQWCMSWCEFFTRCRGRDDTDVTGLIEDPETISAVKLYVEGHELTRAGEKKKTEAKKHLQGVSGNTDTHAVRTVHVSESEVPGYTRKPHTKVDIRRLK